MPVLLKVFQKIEEDRILPNYSYEASIPLVPKPDKDSTRKEKLQHTQITYVIAYDRMMDKNHMIISINAEKELAKI